MLQKLSSEEVVVMTKYKFPCGCEFEILDETIKENDGLPSIKIDYENIPEDCPATWELIQGGQTKGIFQLETNLGKSWSKKSLPSNMIELSALISLIRPGCLRAIVDGKSMTQHYCDRKNSSDEVKYFHEALEPILKETYAVLTYQEQSMRIAQDIAGFDLQEADVLRKAIGKKKADIMAKVKDDFINGCKKVGIVSEKEAEEIFGWIQESQRYSFNKSHGVGYGIMGYWSAYAKAHFPLHFYTSWLYYSHEKMDPQEEMQKLISDAKNFDIMICPPTLKELYNGDPGHFSMKKDRIFFGIEDIKKIGQSHVSKIFNNVNTVEKQLGRNIGEWTWYDFLIFFSDYTSSTVVNGLVAAGATDYMGESRSKKIHEYNAWKLLTAKEKDWIKDNCTTSNSLLNSVEQMVQLRSKLSVSRKAKVLDIIKTLNNPSFSVEDDANFIARHEQELLGVPLTCSKLDSCSRNISPDTTCKELIDGKNGKFLIRVEITGVNEYIIKKGKMKGEKMLFLQVEDETGELDSLVVFPSVISGNEPVFINGSTVLLGGKKDTKYNKDSFIVESVTSI